MGSFSSEHWILLFIMCLAAYAVLRSFTSRNKAILRNGNYVCRNCGTRAIPEIVTKGSVWIEIILWLAMLVPGLIYSIWRVTTRDMVCPECRRNTMIGVHTPIGRMIARRFNADMLDDRIEHHL